MAVIRLNCKAGIQRLHECDTANDAAAINRSMELSLMLQRHVMVGMPWSVTAAQQAAPASQGRLLERGATRRPAFGTSPVVPHDVPQAVRRSDVA